MSKALKRLDAFLANFEKDGIAYTLIWYDDIDEIYRELRKEGIGRKDGKLIRLVKDLRDNWKKVKKEFTKLYEKLIDKDIDPDKYLPNSLEKSAWKLYHYFMDKYD